jgi:ribosome-associated protein
MNLNSKILLPEITFKTSRSGGAGGQNVNKVATKVLLEFDVLGSNLLDEVQKAIVLEKLSTKINTNGVLQIVAQTERNQLGNKELALKKFHKLISNCFVTKKKRKPTKPSKEAKERRLKTKKKTAELKVLRSKIV